MSVISSHQRASDQVLSPNKKLAETLKRCINPSPADYQKIANELGIEEAKVRGFFLGYQTPTTDNVNKLARSYQISFDDQEALFRISLNLNSDQPLPDEVLGLWLKQFREQRQIKQTDLHKKAGIKQVTISAWESGRNPIKPSMIPILAEAIGLTQEEYQLLLRHRLPALNENWLDTAIESPEQRFGLLYDAYRELAGCKVDEVAQALGKSNAWHVIDVAKGRSSFSTEEAKKVETLFEQANHSLPPQYRWFDKERFEQLHKPLTTKRQYLNAHDSAKQAGELLRHIRDEKKLSQAKLAEMIGESSGSIGDWETGRNLLPPRLLGKLRDALDLSEVDYRQLRDTRLPVLNPDYRLKNPMREHGGEAIAALRDMRGLSLQQLASQISLDVNVLGRMEHGRAAIGAKDLMAIHATLKPDSEESKQLIYSVFPALDNAWLSQKLPQQRFGHKVVGLRSWCGLTQEQLEDKLQMPPRAISEIEIATRAPSDDEVSKITSFFDEHISRAHKILIGYNSADLHKLSGSNVPKPSMRKA